MKQNNTVDLPNLILLKQPFGDHEISWKINNYNSGKTKAMITFHVDARVVQTRLNDVFGELEWSFEWKTITDVIVHGSLKVNLCTKEDVGYSNGSDDKEPLKSAVSDALKRCAVHLGVAHYLYQLPTLWIVLDEPSQKYLTKRQDEEILNWYKKNINTSKTTTLLPFATEEVIDQIMEAMALDRETKSIYAGKYNLTKEQIAKLTAARATIKASIDNAALVEGIL